MRITASLLKRIVRSDLQTELITSKDLTKGWDHRVLLLNTKKGKFIIRFPKKDKNKIKIQAWACKKWAKLGVPVPEPFVLKNDYLIETCIPGVDARSSKSSFRQLKNAYVQIGCELKKMHQVETKGFGVFEKPGMGEWCSWLEFIESSLSHDLAAVVSKKRLTAAQAAKVLLLFEQLEPELAKVKIAHLLHGDIARDNFMVVNGSLSGIIDTADSFSGDSLHDLGVLYFDAAGSSVLDWLEQGYGAFDRRKVRFYALLAGVWVLNGAKVKKDILEAQECFARVLAVSSKSF